MRIKYYDTTLYQEVVMSPTCPSVQITPEPIVGQPLIAVSVDEGCIRVYYDGACVSEQPLNTWVTEETCKYCGGNCPSLPDDSGNLCDGFAGDIDGLCAEELATDG